MPLARPSRRSCARTYDSRPRHRTRPDGASGRPGVAWSGIGHRGTTGNVRLAPSRSVQDGFALKHLFYFFRHFDETDVLYTSSDQDVYITQVSKPLRDNGLTVSRRFLYTSWFFDRPRCVQPVRNYFRNKTFKILYITIYYILIYIFFI